MSADPAAVAEARDLLAELVDIPSPSGSEGRIVDRIESLCAEWSLPAMRVRSELGRDSLVVGARERPALACVAHVDTISPPWPARAVVEGDVVHGLGSADDKGGVVACLLAARDLVAAGEDLERLGVAFAFPVDEERGGSGSRTVALELAPAARDRARGHRPAGRGWRRRATSTPGSTSAGAPRTARSPTRARTRSTPPSR